MSDEVTAELSATSEKAGTRLFCAVFIVAMLPLWGISRDFHDGVIAEWALSTGNYLGIGEWLLTSNWWGHYAFYRLCGELASVSGISAWIWIKAWMTLAVLGLCYETFKLAVLYGYQRQSAMLASALVASFPAWGILYSSAVMHFGFAWLAFAGHRWLFWNSGWRRGAGLVLTLLAFQLNANLVLLVVLGAIACWLTPRRRPTTALLATIAMAVLFYLFVSWFHPPHGDYAGYNKVLLPTDPVNLKRMVAAAALFATWGALLIAPLLAAAAVAWLYRRKAVETDSAPDTRRRVVIALLLTVSAAFPYIMVGKGPPLFLAGPAQGNSVTWALYESTGAWLHLTLAAFSVRQATILAVPFALLSVALLHAVAAGFRQPARRLVVAGTAAALVSQLGLLTWTHAAKWDQAHWDQSIVAALRVLPAPPPGRVEIALIPNRPYAYPLQEANYLLWRAWGRTDWVGIIYYQEDRTWEERARQLLVPVDAALRSGTEPTIKQYWLVTGHPSGDPGCTVQIVMAPSTPSIPAPVKWLEWLTESVPPAQVVSNATRCTRTQLPTP